MPHSRSAATTRAATAMHLVVRFSDLLCGGVDTIREHMAVIEQAGAVWFAKMGRPLARYKIDLLSDQIRRGIPTFLFLVQKAGRHYVWAQATLCAISLSLPAREHALTPPYYRDRKVNQAASIWFKVSKISRPRAALIKMLNVASSGNPVSESLAGSMAAMFVVHVGAGNARPCSPSTRKTPRLSLEEAVLDVFEEDDSL